MNKCLLWTVLAISLLVLLSSCAAEKSVYVPQVYGPGSLVAVWEIEDVSVAGNAILADMQDFLSTTIIETLKEKGGYEIIERQKLLLALEELNLGSSALASETSRLEVGRIIGAELMVFGGYQLVANQLRIDLRLVEVETGAIVQTAEQTSSAADISGWLQAAEAAAMKLIGGEAAAFQ